MSDVLYYDLKQTAGPVPNLSSSVARTIGISILSGKIEPGEFIGDEASLEAEHKVSRSVIREAVKTLAAKGLLNVRRRVGTSVRPRSEWSMLDGDVLAWLQSVPADHGHLRQLLEVRQIFEPKAARWAAERGSEASHNAIRAAMESMENANAADDELTHADARFHIAILQATENEFLIALEGVILSALLQSIARTNMEGSAVVDMLPFHQAVFVGIQNRDGDAAEAAMIELLKDAGERLGESSKNDLSASPEDSEMHNKRGASQAA